MIDIEKHKNTYREFDSLNKKDTTHVLSEYEVARWMSLIEAVDIIDQKSKQLGVKSSNVNWVKPIAIQKYIDERTESMLFEIESDLQKEKLCTTYQE